VSGWGSPVRGRLASIAYHDGIISTMRIELDDGGTVLVTFTDVDPAQRLPDPRYTGQFVPLDTLARAHLELDVEATRKVRQAQGDEP
jgi:hypothetical protein